MPDVLAALNRMNRTRVFLAALVVALIGLFLPGTWGAIVLIAVVSALGALLAQTWPATPQPLRVFRLLVLAGLAVIAFIKIGLI
jgi:hypothetical protein